jgi:hypothetical protein
LLIVTLLAAVAVGAFASMGHAARAFAAPPCVLRYDTNLDCASTDPHVVYQAVWLSNTTGCRFRLDVDWGDQSPTQTVELDGGPAGAVFAADHIYAADGTYQVKVTTQVLAGPCNALPIQMRFTLSDPPRCAFLLDHRETCESLHPSAVVDGHYFGSTAGCKFRLDIDWGDASAVQQVPLEGGPAGAIFGAAHTYRAPGEYTIRVTTHVLAGACSGFPATFRFTLGGATPTPTPTPSPAATASPSPTPSPVTPAATVTATPSPAPAKPVRLTPAAAFALPPNKKCVSRRSFRIRIRKVPGVTFISAVVKVRGKAVKTVKRSRITAPVNLTGLPKGRYKVSIVAFTSDGRTVTGTRTYRTCTPKRRSKGPEI